MHWPNVWYSLLIHSEKVSIEITKCGNVSRKYSNSDPVDTQFDAMNYVLHGSVSDQSEVIKRIRARKIKFR